MKGGRGFQATIPECIPGKIKKKKKKKVFMPQSHEINLKVPEFKIKGREKKNMHNKYEKKKKSGWQVFTWFDEFDTRELIESLGLNYEKPTLSASGRIWQASGIHATPNLEYARILLRLVKQKHIEHNHRIVQMIVSRKTTVVK